MKTESLISKVYLLVKPYGRKKLLLVIAVSLLQAILQVVGVTSIFPFFSIATDPEKFRSSQIGEAILPWLPQLNNTDLLVWTGTISLSLLLLSSIVNIVTQFLRSRYAFGFAHWLREQFIRQIAAQPYSYFVKSDPAIINKKLNVDIQQFSQAVLQPMLEVCANIPAIVLLLLSILVIDLSVALGALVTVIGFYVLVFLALSSRRDNIKSGLKSAYRSANSESLNFLNGIKTFKVYGAEPFYLSKYIFHSRHTADFNARLPIYVALPRYLIEPIVFGALIAYVFVLISNGEKLLDVIPVLSVIALAGYRMIPAVQTMYARLSQITAMRHALEEIYDELTLIEQNVSTAPTTDQQRDETGLNVNSVQLTDVYFTYPESPRAVLKGVNIKIAKGEAVAITGESGAGKSTLINIILGLYPPTSGALLINDKALEEAETRLYQSKIGYVQQDCFLSNDSIKANIAFGVTEKDIDNKRLLEACSKAQILDFIHHELEQGFNTTVGERGVKLSGGQRQRIALARALYRDPEILILDEATSALDDKTESLVTEAIDNLQGSITLVVIAHRSNTIRRIPRKYQLANGQLIAMPDVSRIFQ